MTDVHLVVPDGIDNPARPSGGNVYDRRLSAELTGLGWTVHQHHVAGARLLPEIADHALTLVDGLVGSAEAMVAEAARLRLVMLVHMPIGGPVERAVLDAAAAVVTTSQWARQWLVTEHRLAPDKVYVAVPGVDAPGGRAASASGRRRDHRSGGNLLCVGPVTRDKGYDVLMDALDRLQDLSWHCTVAGALDLDPEPVAPPAGLADRLSFLGPVTQDRLDTIRSSTDLVVSASRRESYGMAVAEGLARGIPAVVTDIGGHPEVIGDAGVLVPVGDTDRLASALRGWLTDSELRQRLRRSAARRSTELATWTETAHAVTEVLTSVGRAASASERRRDHSVNRTLLEPVSPSNKQTTGR